MKRILIAEDDPDARRLLASLMNQLGFNVAEATDGLDAIHRLRDAEFDLVIVDLMMPRIDGYVVIRYLEEQRPDTRAIVISGVRPEELDGIGHSDVVDAVLPKPIDFTELTARVQQSVGNGNHL